MKILKYTIPILFLIISIAIIESGFYVKNIGKGKEIPEILNTMETNIENDEWDTATQKAEKLREIFKTQSRLIQFSVERDEIFQFIFNLALLEGYLKTKDHSNCIAQIHILSEYWKEFGK